jgi:hypothetical protein
MPSTEHHTSCIVRSIRTITRTKILAGTVREKIFYTHLKLNITNTYLTKLHTSYIL